MLFNELKKNVCLLLILITFSCISEKGRLDEIRKISNVNIPDDSTILKYCDNLSTEVAFKISIEKEKVNDFLKINQFQPVDTLKTNLVSKTLTDKYLIDDIENSLVPQEKIFRKDLLIFRNKNTTIIVNRETSELWGIMSYD